MSLPGCRLHAVTQEGVRVIAVFYNAEQELNKASKFDTAEFERMLVHSDSHEAFEARQALASLHRAIFRGDVIFRSDHTKK